MTRRHQKTGLSQDWLLRTVLIQDTRQAGRAVTAGDRDRTEAVLQAHLSNASAASSSSHKAWLGTVLKWSLRDVLEQEAQRAEEDLRGAHLGGGSANGRELDLLSPRDPRSASWPRPRSPPYLILGG